jgi:NADH-quinone oxidoreductase subunit G
MRPPGDAREDWRILRAFSATIGHALPYDSMEALRTRLQQANPVFGHTGLARFGANDLTGPAPTGEIGDAPFTYAVESYYLSNTISRASATMAECARVAARPLAMAAE